MKKEKTNKRQRKDKDRDKGIYLADVTRIDIYY